MADASARQPTPVPEAVGYVRSLLLGFGPPWFLSGGWAADAWLGRHLDLPAHIHVPTRPSSWGLPAATPEVVLFFKGSADLRPRDEVDFLALLPILTAAQRSWLQASLAEVRPSHPWLSRLVQML